MQHADYTTVREFLRRIRHPVALVGLKPLDPTVKPKIIWPVEQGDDLADQACGLNGDYFSVYCNLNPLVGYMHDVQPEPWQSVQDKMIAARTRVLIDIDGHDVPKEVARRQKDEIKAELGNSLIETDSGNGFGLIYTCDLPNDPNATGKLEAFLTQLKARWSCVDTSVYTSSRLTRVIGTMNRSRTNGERIPTSLLN